MSDLISALKKRIELPQTIQDILNQSDDGSLWVDGVDFENKRLKPVLLALCECAEALEIIEHHDKACVQDALARLKEAVSGEDGE